jgi:integrase
MNNSKHGLGGVYLRKRKWWIRYSVHGVRYRESSESEERADAVRLLKKRIASIAQGKPVGAAVERTTLGELAEVLLNDYRANGRRSVVRAQIAFKALFQFFNAHARVNTITPDRITAYQAHRLKLVKAATANFECAILSRAFHLALRAGKVANKPEIVLLSLNNARKGFFEPEQVRALLAHLPPYLKPVAQAAYITGWRAYAELLSRQWRHLDLTNGWLRIEPGESKNLEGREFPLTPELRALLEAQRVRMSNIERAYGKIVPWIFTQYNGKPIGKGYRCAFKRACRDAGVPTKLMHDFRRTAVRNLERAGVPRSAAMAMTGHRTEAIYRRYAIFDESMLREAAVSLAALHARDAQ